MSVDAGFVLMLGLFSALSVIVIVVGYISTGFNLSPNPSRSPPIERWKWGRRLFARVAPQPEPAPAPLEWTFDPAPLHETGDKLHDAVHRAEHAQRLLQDELLLWALGQMRQRVRDQMETCPIRDTEGMQTLRLWLDVLKGFEANLKSLVGNGIMAGDEIARANARREYEERYGRAPI